VTNRIQESIPLAPLTTLGIGGPARYLAEAATRDALGEAIAFARSRTLPILILGGGSNLLVSDAGFPGLVIGVRLKGVEWAGARVRAEAGVEWDSLVDGCVGRNLAGAECLSGIPGSVGGTPVQNVGAYGQEVSDVITNVEVYDLGDDTVRNFSRDACGFAYRSSLFNSSGRGRFIVLGVEYGLRAGAAPCLVYPDLSRFFDNRSGVPTLAEVRDAVLGIRRGKAMLRVEGDPDCHSAGSFFRNPVLSSLAFDELEDRCRRRGVDSPVPSYRAGDSVKVPAAWLVEHAGFPKGSTDGPVGLSRKHALAVINRGGAKAGDILRFAGAIQDSVEDVFGIRLSTEPAFVGFSDEVVARFGAVIA
jgi:UDP-N-acetylmuramate dehydrogenase